MSHGEGFDYQSTQILHADGSLLEQDEPAKILVIGDSYTRYPERTRHVGSVESANLAAQLTANTRINCRNFTVSSGCPIMAKLIHQHSEILEGVEVCVFVVSPYHLWSGYSGMWQHVPF